MIVDDESIEPLWEEVDPEMRWRFETFTKLIADLDELARTRDDVRRRAEFAATVEERTLTGERAARLWAEARAGVRDTYDGLELEPQLGLLPLGPDPFSGLWEFADTQTGEPPIRGSDRTLQMKEESGVVFVLIPGGQFWMGAQRHWPDRPNYDPQASNDEGPVHEVQLSPFLISKYEMTQGQWKRITGSNPSRTGPDSQWSTDWSESGREASLLQPVDSVDWFDCMGVMRKLDWQLPSEAQWEYAARAGTSTPWWTGTEKESLLGAANIADAFARDHREPELDEVEAWLDDGNLMPALVDELLPNPFGLHHVHGNAWEWCLDEYTFTFYGTSTGLDPVANPQEAGRRVDRGGGYSDTAPSARSAHRDSFSPLAGDHNLGLRPARAILQ